MYFGAGDEVTQKLIAALKTAREERMKENRAAGRGVCVGETRSGALLLQPAAVQNVLLTYTQSLADN
jgi:hypothetical protein